MGIPFCRAVAKIVLGFTLGYNVCIGVCICENLRYLIASRNTRKTIFKYLDVTIFVNQFKLRSRRKFTVGIELTFVFNEIMLRKGVGVNKWRLGEQL
jgi:hypothetical protein